MERSRDFGAGRIMRVLLPLAAALTAPAAFAGGPEVTVFFGPEPFTALNIPTLGTASLIALALLLAVIALRTAKEGKAGRAAAVALCSIGLVAGGFGVERAMATSSVGAAGELCQTGGSDLIFLRDGNWFSNNCPHPMAVYSYQFVNPGDACTLVPNTGQEHPPCILNALVAPGSTCALAVCEND